MITPIQISAQKMKTPIKSDVDPDPAEITEAALKGWLAMKELLALIGELSMNWSNNESQFIYVIRALLKTDDAAAAIVFATLNTTRSRLDLVSRLARVRLKGSPLHQEVNAIVKDFLARTRFRNELNHATFIAGATGAISHTLSTKIDERGSTLTFGTKRMMDQKRIEEMVREIAALKSINRRLLDIIPKLEAVH
jgi:hypothetical protein